MVTIYCVLIVADNLLIVDVKVQTGILEKMKMTAWQEMAHMMHGTDAVPYNKKLCAKCNKKDYKKKNISSKIHFRRFKRKTDTAQKQEHKK